MAAKTLTEAIALTEKKMDMTLEDIIKMSKKSSVKGRGKPRVSNKSQGFLNGRAPGGNNSMVQQFMKSRSSIRQGVLAQRRSNFLKNQFAQTTEIAKMAASIPIRRNIVVNQKLSRAPVPRRNYSESTADKDKALAKQRPQTLDARFANINEQRMRATLQQQQQHQHQQQLQQQVARGAARQTRQRFRAQQQRQRGRGIRVAPGGSNRRYVNQ